MRGFSGNRTARRLAPLVLMCSFACTEDSDELDAGPADGGAAVDAAGLPDAGPPPDAGPERRTMQTRSIVPADQVENHMLAPDFDLGMFNLGWSSGGIQGGAAPLHKRVDPSVPGARPEWVRIPARDAAPPATFLIGFGHTPPGPLRVEVWIAQTETATAPGAGVEVGLHGVDLPGETRALLLEVEPGPGVVVDGLRWRRWAAEESVRWVGFATFLVINRSSTPLGVGTPTLVSAPEPAVVGEIEARRPRQGRLREPHSDERRVIAETWRRRSRSPPSVDPVGAGPRF